MTYEEALTFAKEYITLNGIRIDARESTRCIVEALEKQIPKKPIPVTPKVKNAQWFHKWQSCPSCNHCFGHCFRREKISYCPECGQAVDYSEVE